MDQLVVKSDIVVTGTVDRIGELYNGARNPEDPSQPDPELYSVQRKVHVVADQTLKGSVPDRLVVSQWEDFFDKSEMTIDEWEARGGGRYSNSTPTEIGMTYTFFLRASAWQAGVWIPASCTYRFRHTGEGNAIPEGDFNELNSWFKGITQQHLYDGIQQAVASP